MQKASLVLIFFAVLALTSYSLAETSGTINSTGNSINNTIVVTGLFGYTVNTCTSNATCLGYQCFFDFDLEGLVITTTTGLCNQTTVTNCYHDTNTANSFTLVANGGTLCVNTTTYRTCNSGTWLGLLYCPSGQTCSNPNGPGACAIPASPNDNSGSNSGYWSALGGGAPTPKINITSYPSKIDVLPGNSTNATVTVKNTGNVTLSSIALSISGVNNAWYAITPLSLSILSPGNSNFFVIKFVIPNDTETKSYALTLSVTTNYTYGTASASIALNILPKPEMYAAINKTYENYTALLDIAERNLSLLENRSNADDVAGVRSIINDARTKINTAGSLIQSNDYFNAKLLLDDAKNLIDAANRQLAQVRPAAGTTNPLGDNTLLYIVAGVVAIIVVAVAYLFWPSRGERLSKQRGERLFKKK